MFCPFVNFFQIRTLYSSGTGQALSGWNSLRVCLLIYEFLIKCPKIIKIYENIYQIPSFKKRTLIFFWCLFWVGKLILGPLKLANCLHLWQASIEELLDFRIPGFSVSRDLYIFGSIVCV